jgi:hypothetical protein
MTAYTREKREFFYRNEWRRHSGLVKARHEEEIRTIIHLLRF